MTPQVGNAGIMQQILSLISGGRGSSVTGLGGEKTNPVEGAKPVNAEGAGTAKNPAASPAAAAATTGTDLFKTLLEHILPQGEKPVADGTVHPNTGAGAPATPTPNATGKPAVTAQKEAVQPQLPQGAALTDAIFSTGQLIRDRPQLTAINSGGGMKEIGKKLETVQKLMALLG